MNMPDLSVIVPVFRHWDDFRLCLEHIEKQSFPRDRFELIVVNNDPTVPPPPDLAQSWFQILDESKPGSYAARNTALKAAKGDVLVFTDADCQPGPDWLLAVARYFQDHPECRRVGGAIRVIEDPKAEPLAQLHDRHFALRQDNYVAHGWAATANMAARRAVFDQIGGFEEVRKSGGDRHWGRSAQAAGIPITYLSDPYVAHPPRQTTAAILAKHRRLMGGRMEEKRKRGLTSLRADYIIRTPFRVLPRISIFRRVYRSDLVGSERWKMLFFLHRIKWAEWVERGRLLFLDAESRRA